MRDLPSISYVSIGSGISCDVASWAPIARTRKLPINFQKPSEMRYGQVLNPQPFSLRIDSFEHLLNRVAVRWRTDDHLVVSKPPLR